MSDNLTTCNSGTVTTPNIPVNIGTSTTGTYITYGNGVNINYNPSSYTWETANFKKISDKLSSLLSTSYKEIVDNYICFNVYLEGHNVRPIEDIMLMINKGITFDVLLGRYGYNILIKNAKFIKIKNLIESSAKEYIKVEFVYDEMEYDNIFKTKLEKRAEKLELLKHKMNKNDI